jgi:hypothetical protein
MMTGLLTLSGVGTLTSIAASRSASPLATDAHARAIDAKERLESWVIEQVRGSRLDLSDRAHVILGCDRDFELGDGRGSLFATTCESASRAGVDGLMPWLIRTSDGWAIRSLGRKRPPRNGEAHLGQFLCYARESPRFLSNWRVSDPTGRPLNAEALARSYLRAVASWTDLEFLLPVLASFVPERDWPAGARVPTLRDLASIQVERQPSSVCFGAHWWWSIADLTSEHVQERIGRSARARVDEIVIERIERLTREQSSTGELRCPDVPGMAPSDDIGMRVSFVSHTLAWMLKCNVGSGPVSPAMARRAIDWLAATSVAQAPLLSLPTACHACHAIRLACSTPAIWTA